MPAMPLPAWHPNSLAARLPYLRRRALLTQATRAFFTARGYTEVETPYAVPTPGKKSTSAPSPPSATTLTAGANPCGCTPARNSP